MLEPEQLARTRLVGNLENGNLNQENLYKNMDNENLHNKNMDNENLHNKNIINENLYNVNLNSKPSLLTSWAHEVVVKLGYTDIQPFSSDFHSYNQT